MEDFPWPPFIYSNLNRPFENKKLIKSIDTSSVSYILHTTFVTYLSKCLNHNHFENRHVFLFRFIISCLVIRKIRNFPLDLQIELQNKRIPYEKYKLTQNRNQNNTQTSQIQFEPYKTLLSTTPIPIRVEKLF